MELARLKLERLYEGTHQTVSQPTSTETVGHVEGKASVNPLGPLGQDSKPVTTTLPVWSASSVRQPVTTTRLTFQSGIDGMDATAIYTQSTLPRVLSSFQLDGECHHGISNQVCVLGNPWVSASIQLKLAEQVKSVFIWFLSH